MINEERSEKTNKLKDTNRIQKVVGDTMEGWEVPKYYQEIGIRGYVSINRKGFSASFINLLKHLCPRNWKQNLHNTKKARDDHSFQKVSF